MSPQSTVPTIASLGMRQVADARFHRQLRTQVGSALAVQLGLSEPQLSSQLASGKSLADVARLHGVGREQLLATILSILRSVAAAAPHRNPAALVIGRSDVELRRAADRIADHVSLHPLHDHAGGTALLTG